MKVICAGWGRTGTRSLKYALQTLLNAPAYHMQNILLNKKDAKLWYNIIFKKPNQILWEDIFNGYEACLDFPSCNYYKKLMEEYPDAKVILTIRDEDSWIKSWNVLNNQIIKSFTFRFISKIPFTSFYLQKKIHNEAILGPRGMFKGLKNDNDIKKQFLKWNQSVIDYVPKDRLLVYQVKDGWKPLCDFLDLPNPDIPFFHKNKTKNMKHMSRFIGSVFIISIITLILTIIFAIYFFSL
ncbi:MAG: hypothetical protein CBD97_00745 [Pelagibacteraceae bacterium TMED237]|nr:hypothetical protein [Candidatus Neomarinimicrobiota bacterium]OUW96745.1 MAG: hypothetical protein CBD97_00745 [Pelagibacteraceae bacterium TMED237]|tara:strand:+ start:5930 stop:6646 length:717 start_codon:yes stop_codon:yes gene_type:complete